MFSVLCGAVIGAGFLSGAELIVFFGADNFVFPLALAGALFACCFACFFLNEKSETVEIAVHADGGFFEAAGYVAAFIFLSGMLAGLDETANIGFFRKFPAVSVLALIFAVVYSRRGGRGLVRLNVVLTPVSVVIVNAFIILAAINGDFAARENNAVAFTANRLPELKKCVNAALYAFMNVFAASPALKVFAREKDKKTLVLSSAAFGAYAFVQAAVILFAISGMRSAVASETPVLAAFGNSRYGFLLRGAVFLGIFTSFYSFFLPVYDGMRKKRGEVAAFGVILAAFMLSRIGFSRVISRLYPVAGAFGGAFCVKNFLSVLKKRSIKNRSLNDNI